MKNRLFTHFRPLSVVILLAGGGLLATACQKDDAMIIAPVAPVSPATDEAIIQKYIADNAITGAQRQPSGLYFVPVTTNASAVQATAGKTVSVLYTGMLLNGNVFDASSQHDNKPFSFVLEHKDPQGNYDVITGWEKGIALMHKGEKAILLIPSALGYGERGAGQFIPPNSVLRFDVELTDVK